MIGWVLLSVVLGLIALAYAHGTDGRRRKRRAGVVALLVVVLSLPTLTGSGVAGEYLAASAALLIALGALLLLQLEPAIPTLDPVEKRRDP